MQEKLIKHIALYFDITARPFKNGVKFNVQSLDTDNIIELLKRWTYNIKNDHMDIPSRGVVVIN